MATIVVTSSQSAGHDPAPALDEDYDWRAALRAHRVARRISRPEVARRSGLSLSTVKAYECGNRHPSRAALDAIVRALGLSHDEANPIRSGAGFAIDWRAVIGRRYIVDLDVLRAQADDTPWPVFITNQGSYVLHWNPAFALLWDVDVERDFPDPLTRNLLSGASIARFTRCIVSYDETMAFFLGMIKGDPRAASDFEHPAPWHHDAMAKVVEGDPSELRRLLDAWERTAPIQHQIRHHYPVAWRYHGDGPVLRFRGVLTPCDIWNELNWQEWVPADAETHARMAAIMSSQAR